MAYTLTIQPDAAAGKDTFLHSASATTNFSTNANLAIGEESPTVAEAYRSLITFDLSGIPAGAVLTAATLSLWEHTAVAAAGAPASWAVELRKVLVNWVEAEATWNKYSTAGGNWGTAGCSNATDRGATVLATTTLDGTAANDFVSWSGPGLMAFFQAVVDGAANYGLLLSAPTAEMLGTTPRAYSSFYSSAYATDAAKRPKLVLEHYTGSFPVIGSPIIRGMGAQ